MSRPVPTIRPGYVYVEPTEDGRFVRSAGEYLDKRVELCLGRDTPVCYLGVFTTGGEPHLIVHVSAICAVYDSE